MKKLLFITIAALVLLAGCATPIQEETQQVRLPREVADDYGAIASSSVAVPEPVIPAEEVVTTPAAEMEPVTEVEVADELVGEPSEVVETTEAGVVATEEVAQAEVIPEESSETKQPETAAAVEKESSEPEPEADKEPEVIADADPEDPVQQPDSEIVREIVPLEPAHETAAKEVEDKDSSFLRAAWFGLPVLLLLMVILVVEMVRWAVYRKPLFGWNNGRAEQPAEALEKTPGLLKRTGSRVSRRFRGFIDKLYADLEADDDEEDDLI